MRVVVRPAAGSGYRWEVWAGEQLIARGWEETVEEARTEAHRWLDERAGELRPLLLRAVPDLDSTPRVTAEREIPP